MGPDGRVPTPLEAGWGSAATEQHPDEAEDRSEGGERGRDSGKPMGAVHGGSAFR
jgi:hypothetical protein